MTACCHTPPASEGRVIPGTKSCPNTYCCSLHLQQLSLTKLP
uniref:Uncharacterized protein n=1 Tax=Arundo donax TaxID=35708 RepID=A0A0A9APP6_ARUDO